MQETKFKARDVMETNYHTLLPQTKIGEAVQYFREVGQQEGRKIFGMMVTNEQEELVGMLSMYDILLCISPKHVNIWGEMEDLEPVGLFDKALERAKYIQVGEIMSTEVITVTPDTHVLMIIDIMLKKHIRRIPVVQEQKVLGIVYIAPVFYKVLQRFWNE